MEKRAFVAVAVMLGGASVLAWSSRADAQEFLRDHRVAYGSGLDVGGFDVHPSLAAEVGWDSNYFGRSDKTGLNIENGAPTLAPIDTGILRVTPAISFSMAPRSADGHGGPFVLEFGASGTYREFFNPALTSQRNMSANADAGIKILPGHEWNGSLSGTFSRLVQPSVLGNPDISYNNDTVSATADLGVQPNLGTLNWHVGYTIAATIFEQAGGDPYNFLLNTGYTRGQWRFRPRTALIYDGQVSYRDYSDAAASGFVLHQSTPVRARLGMEGLITPAFSVIAMVGYGGSFNNPNSPGDTTVQQYDSVIGNVELRFYPLGSQPDADGKPSLLVSTIALGFNRDFAASFLGDVYGTDRGYLKAEYFFNSQVVVTLMGGVGTLEHPNIYMNAAPGNPGGLLVHSYTDVSADATLFAEYRIFPSLGINATGTYIENFSNTELPVAVGSSQVYDMNYRRITAFAGVRWFM